MGNDQLNKNKLTDVEADWISLENKALLRKMSITDGSKVLTTEQWKDIGFHITTTMGGDPKSITSDSNIKKKCNCALRVLMAEGCQCGGD